MQLLEQDVLCNGFAIGPGLRVARNALQSFFDELQIGEHAVVQAAVRVISNQTGRTPQLRPWAFATDGGHSCGVHGIPTIGFAPGEERFAHTNRERLDLAQARVAYDAYPYLIRAIQAQL